MSVQSHLEQLEIKHEALESAIIRETHSPAGNDLKIAELKRKKLKIKDEISMLSMRLAG